MRPLIISLMLLLIPSLVFARQRRDTVYTRQGDKVILMYDLSSDGTESTITFNMPRIIPSEALRESCKGDNGRLKAVIFSRVGDYGRVKWRGLTPAAFTVPAGVTCSRAEDGYFILGESAPLSFNVGNFEKKVIKLPIYIAVYEKTRTYRIVAQSSKPIAVNIGKSTTGRRVSRNHSEESKDAGEIMVTTTVEGYEGANEETLRALGSVNMVQEMLDAETEYPFSESLRMEIYNLRAYKDRVKDAEVLEKINNVLLECSQKEHQLKEQAQNEARFAEAEAKSEQARQAQEEKERIKAQENEAKVQQEQQKKRTVWMIAGGVILAILGFVGNALFKHFQNIRNQRNIMEMQESIARQAQHEAGRRAQEIVRNKAHVAVNKGRNKVRNAMESRTSVGRGDSGSITKGYTKSDRSKRSGNGQASRGISDNNRKTI